MGNEDKKKSFEHSAEENVDGVFNYLSMISQGIKNRKISLRKDENFIELDIPDNAKFTISAEKKKKGGEIVFRLEWKESEANKDKKKKKNK